MNRLNNKKIYYIVTGAPKAKFASRIIKEIIQEGARVFTIPTPAGLNFINIKELEKIPGNKIKTDWDKKIKLPKEDAILVAPCTLNTLNAIAAGLANNYPLCLIASAIGRKTPVFIAPAMNINLWGHPLVQENIQKLESWSCKIIWPRISKNKVTMTDVGKILDTLYFSFKRINFSEEKIINKKLENKLKDYQKKYFNHFREIGKFLDKNNLNLPTAGCMSIKVPKGFLISSSGCDLSRNFKKENISLITYWDDKRNLIRWIGDKVPSSESPLHCVINANKNHSILLHIHCPRMTYSYKLKKYATKRYQRYGTFNIGYKILKLLKKNNFCIIRYHGEVILGKDIAEIKNTLNKFNKLVLN